MPMLQEIIKTVANGMPAQLKALQRPIPINEAEMVAMPSRLEPILYLVGLCMMALSCRRRFRMPVT